MQNVRASALPPVPCKCLSNPVIMAKNMKENVLGKNDDLKKITEEEIVEHFITESALTSQSNINLKKLKMISTNVLKRLKSNYTADEIVYYIKNAILDDDQTAITNYHDIFSYFNTAMKKYINFVIIL